MLALPRGPPKHFGNAVDSHCGGDGPQGLRAAGTPAAPGAPPGTLEHTTNQTRRTWSLSREDGNVRIQSRVVCGIIYVG